MRIRLLLARTAEGLCLLLFAVGILTTLSFVGAETPDGALRNGYPAMPAQWEAACFNHGSYYRWVTIKHHPVLFALSLACLFGGQFAYRWIQTRFTFPAELAMPIASQKATIRPRFFQFAAFAITTPIIHWCLTYILHRAGLQRGEFSDLVSMPITAIIAVLLAFYLPAWWSRRKDIVSR